MRMVRHQDHAAARLFAVLLCTAEQTQGNLVFQLLGHNEHIRIMSLMSGAERHRLHCVTRLLSCRVQWRR